jgi:hypothetical protein
MMPNNPKIANDPGPNLVQENNDAYSSVLLNPC